MRLTELPSDDLLAALRPTRPRATGLHLTDVIEDLERTVLRARRGTFDEKAMERFQAAGFLWEHILEEGLIRVALNQDRYIRPEEFRKDGIICSPDCIDTVDWAVEEWKCTYRSSNRDIRKDFWRWWAQIKAYCHVIGTLRARLLVLFIVGNWGRGGDWQGAVPRVWRADFMPSELEENWAMILQHAESMRPEKEEEE